MSIDVCENDERCIKQYTYDDSGNLSCVATFYDATESGEIHYQYDEQGNLIKEVSYYQGEERGYIDYQYDEDGNLLEYNYCDNDGNAYFGQKYQYDDGNLVWKSDGGIEWSYEYDATGKCVAMYEVFPYDEYDGRSLVYKTDYIYDEHGNNIRAGVYFGWNEDGSYEYKYIFLFEYEYLGDEPEPEPEVQFTDLVETSTYYDAVLWAVDKGITTGTDKTHFSPKADCTRAQIITFLWRYAGEPEPTTTTHNFVDIVEDSSYYKAVLWAVEEGITTGADSTHFNPKGTCTRAQIVTFLWRYAGKPQPSSQKHSFTDLVKESSYYDAVLWAVEKGITTGVDSTHFNPKKTCTRAQGMTFLYRYNNNK